MLNRVRPWLPWLVTLAAVWYALWPSSLERYATASAYSQLYMAVHSVAIAARQVSQGLEPGPMIEAKHRLDEATDTILREPPGVFPLLQGADRLHAGQWQEWQETLFWTIAAVSEAAGTGDGPISLPVEEKVLIERIAADLETLANDIFFPPEPPGETRLMNRRLGSYLTSARRQRIASDMAALAEDAYQWRERGLTPEP